MESVESITKNKTFSSQNETLIRKVNYDNIHFSNCRDCGEVYQSENNNLFLDLEILQKNPNNQDAFPNRVLVSVYPRVPQVHTLYVAEKEISSESAQKDTEDSTALIDETEPSSFSEGESSNSDVTCIAATKKALHKCTLKSYSDVQSDFLPSSDLCARFSEEILTLEKSFQSTRCCLKSNKFYTDDIIITEQRPIEEKCYYSTRITYNMNPTKINPKAENGKKNAAKSDKATLIITNTSSEESVPSTSALNQLHKRIENLERKMLRQEMVFRSFDPNLVEMSSSATSQCEERKDEMATHPCYNSYVDQYSHVPETSGFQRFSQQLPSPSTSVQKTIIGKEHNSAEQYCRDFTTYDGITNTRNKRRESASMPLNNRCDALNAATAPKLRTKHNPVRDYRLMDTVHYLAQGEFAPRNDGIKLTPSREAVLSDIIWEDVCRSHWPNTRLTRRINNGKPDRTAHRSDLQRHIDNLLRDRITHIERRRRRHYRVMKVNQDNDRDSEKPRIIGKTGDIIVASNKSTKQYKRASESEAGMASDATGTSSTMTSYRRSTRPAMSKHGRNEEMATLDELETRNNKSRQDVRCCPGTSHTAPQRSNYKCSQLKTTHSGKPLAVSQEPTRTITNQPSKHDLHSGACSDMDSAKFPMTKSFNPRLVVNKKDLFRKKSLKKEIHLTKEHYILLPTLVVKTPSIASKQNKYNHLYKVLNKDKENEGSVTRSAEPPLLLRSGHSVSKIQKPNHKDIGLNVNITHTTSEEENN